MFKHHKEVRGTEQEVSRILNVDTAFRQMVNSTVIALICVGPRAGLPSSA